MSFSLANYLKPQEPLTQSFTASAAALADIPQWRIVPSGSCQVQLIILQI